MHCDRACSVRSSQEVDAAHVLLLSLSIGASDKNKKKIHETTTGDTRSICYKFGPSLGFSFSCPFESRPAALKVGKGKGSEGNFQVRTFLCHQKLEELPVAWVK